jgi:hypothetical protein
MIANAIVTSTMANTPCAVFRLRILEIIALSMPPGHYPFSAPGPAQNASVKPLNANRLGADLAEDATQFVDINRLDQVKIEPGFLTSSDVVVSSKAC